VRVAIITESFLPRVNGVTNSVCRVLEHLALRGHEAVVIAPAPGPDSYAGHRVVQVPGLPLPLNSSFVVGLPTSRIERTLREFAPDVVHLASPFVLGAAGVAAARRLGVPEVAVFQTDVAGFARRYRLLGTNTAIWGWLRRIHDQADRTLAPSSATTAQLIARGFPRIARWGRGVDLARFSPSHRCDEWRRSLTPDGVVLVGYVGRLAPEKQVKHLRQVADLPGTRLVLVGNGPAERRLRRLLPGAVFLGCLSGADLSRAYASLDVFVHTGADETFCQAVQEALASGLPVVAPAAGGPLDLIVPGHNGLLYPAQHPAALRAAVSQLAADPDGRAMLGSAARRSVLERSWQAVGDELLGHYAAVSGIAARRAAA
jgi:phosphatidylinositol alpha 1,6-mannosyltransferase